MAYCRSQLQIVNRREIPTGSVYMVLLLPSYLFCNHIQYATAQSNTCHIMIKVTIGSPVLLLRCKSSCGRCALIQFQAIDSVWKRPDCRGQLHMVCAWQVSDWKGSDCGGQLHIVCCWQVPDWIRSAHFCYFHHDDFIPIPAESVQTFVFSCL
jgi:hypothetical protein